MSIRFVTQMVENDIYIVNKAPTIAEGATLISGIDLLPIFSGLQLQRRHQIPLVKLLDQKR